MARVELGNVIDNQAGRPVSGATVQVNVRGAGAATVYDAETGGATVTNPLTTLYGRVEGWVDEGSYDLVITLPGATSYTERFEAGRGDSLVSVEAGVVWTNLAKHGLVEGGSIDAPLTAAKAALGANGGTIFINPGSYTSSSPPSFAETRNVTIRGSGGLTAGATSATKITYTGTAARWIDARSSFGFVLEDLMLLYDQAGFTGNLVDLGQSIAQDAAYARISQCFIGSAAQTTAVLINLERTISSSVTNCTFTKGSIAIQGRGAATYSNAIQLRGNTFIGQGTIAIKNPGEAWLIDGCTFEPTAANENKAILSDQTGEGVTVIGCWFGDGNDTGSWIDYTGFGLAVIGNEFGNGTDAVKVSATSEGITVIGNKFESITNGVVLTSGCQEVCVLGNYFLTVTNKVVVGGTPRGIWQDDTGYISVGSRLTIDGDDTIAWRKRAANQIQTPANLESAGSVQTFQGAATSVFISDSGVMQLGSGANGNLFLDSKGTGQVQLNTQNGATGGTRIEAAAGKVGFFGTAPIARVAAYTPTNVTPDRSFDADTVAIAELADVVGTLIADLKAYGLLQ